jgi:kinesin family protein 15
LKIKNQQGRRSPRLSQANLPKVEDGVVNVEFNVKCHYLEIYNEVIIDLLDSTQPKVQIRETPDRGVFPEPCAEETVSSIQEVMNLISKGGRNRHVGATNMNKESSRSHAIFTAIIQMTQHHSNGQSFIKTSRFHIVDLAGSERTKDTGAEGQRLKEAGAINKSLTILGKVIFDLSEISGNGNGGLDALGKGKHIPYRDSKLTYLLRDALGGNSKTVMICNVNPHIDALKETKSTV